MRERDHVCLRSRWASAGVLSALLALGCSDEGSAITRGDRGSTPKASGSRAVAIQVAAARAWLAKTKDSFVVDLRPPEAFAAVHIRGAINLQHGYEQFALRVRRFFARGARLLLVDDDVARAKASAHSVESAFAEVAWLDAEVSTAVDELGRSQQKTCSARETAEWLETEQALLIDARTSEEYAQGHAPAAVFVYPDDFPRQSGFLRRDKKIVVVCEGGWRSSLLASWLAREGFGEAYNLMEGMKAWREAGLAIERGDEQRAFRE